jgi:hypothetical protein
MSILKNFVNPWGLDTGVLETGVLDTDVLNISMVNRTDNERYDYYNEKGEFVKTENNRMPLKYIYIRGITKPVSLLELGKIQKEHGLYQEIVNSWVRTGNFDLISTNYILSITNNQGSILTTQGLFGELLYIDISQEFIDNSLKNNAKLAAGLISLAHEFIHVYQRTTTTMKWLWEGGDFNSNIRELIAYHFTLYPNTSWVLEETNFKIGISIKFEDPLESTRAVWTWKAQDYYKHIVNDDKYASLSEKRRNDIAKIGIAIKDKKEIFEEKGYKFNYASVNEFIKGNIELLMKG